MVRSLSRASVFWRETLGLPLIAAAEVADQGVRAALLGAGACEVELLEPTTEASGVARFLAGRGEGLHHLCLESDDVGRELERLAARGVDLIDAHPRPGLAGAIAFLHPRSCAGILFELATPTRHGVPPPAPLALGGIELRVDDVSSACDRYHELFGFAFRRAGAEPARALVSDVELAVTAAAGARAGLGSVTLEAPAVAAVRSRLEQAGMRMVVAGAGLALDPAECSGVPLRVVPSEGVPIAGGEPGLGGRRA